jgi:hypothetical protein
VHWEGIAGRLCVPGVASHCSLYKKVPGLAAHRGDGRALQGAIEQCTVHGISMHADWLALQHVVVHCRVSMCYARGGCVVVHVYWKGLSCTARGLDMRTAEGVRALQQD